MGGPRGPPARLVGLQRTLGSQGTKKNTDGSYDVYFGPKPPTGKDKEANWLPAPKGDFWVMPSW